MPKPYSLDLRERVVNACDAGLSSKEVAKKYSVSVSWVKGLLKRRRETGSIAPVSHPYHGMLALVLLGLIAQMPTVAQIGRWAKKHWNTLKEPLNFKSKTKKPPVDTTLFHALAKTTIADFQHAVATFLQAIIAEDDATLTAAIDGKAARQMKDADGNLLLMLNIFAHNIKVTLMSLDVNGDKTKEHGGDYLFQIKGNQPDILDVANTCFAEVDPDKPDATTVEKGGKCRSQKNLVRH